MRTVVYTQRLPIPLEEAWKFFSSPYNLAEISHPDLKFEIISSPPDVIYKGLEIRYRIKPMVRVPVIWVTEITEVEEGKLFIDEQKKGPYKYWHHEHHFAHDPAGVLVTDKLTYDVGWWPVGGLVGKVWVDKQIDKIFDYRREKLVVLFGKG